MNELESNTKKIIQKARTTSEHHWNKKVQVRRRCYCFSHWVKVLSSLITTLKLYKKLYFNSKWNFTLNRVVQVKLCMSYCCRRVVLYFFLRWIWLKSLQDQERWCICVHMCLHAQIIHIPPVKTICMHLVHTVYICAIILSIIMNTNRKTATNSTEENVF